ncbi:hypothetical protein VJ923_03135 [Adlercreutzia sp. R25]|nr:hypothetical protein [Adlercreutzia sp. R25]
MNMEVAAMGNDLADAITVEVPANSQEISVQQLEESKIEGIPVLKNWKPAPVFSALGALCWLFVWRFLALLCIFASSLALGSDDRSYMLGLVAALVFQVAIVAVYALLFYPSYYKEKPPLKSSRAISFLNYLLGGVVFGWCWNSNLKRSHLIERPEKGVSHIVMVVLQVIVLVFYLAMYVPYLVDASMPEANLASDYDEVESYSIKGASPSMSQSDEGDRLVDTAAGVSFVVPKGWHGADLMKERHFIRWKAYPNDNATAGITYGASLAEEVDPDDLVAEDFEGIISEILEDCQDEAVERVNIGGTDYWMITGTGINVQEEFALPVSATFLMSFENGFGYSFQYLDYSQGQDASRYYSDFIEMVESVVYG